MMSFDSPWFTPPLLDAWYLTGPTAAGKTRVALELARRIDAEIVSLDSMAVYRGMDIGTAKPTTEQTRLVPHHLIDVVDPTEEYSVSRFVQDAHQVVADLKRRGKQALFVGGSPLYLKTLLRGMFLGPPADWEFRRQVEEEVSVHGYPALRRRLEQVDPLTAAKLLEGDVRRATRALEVAKATGRPLSHWQTQFERASRAEDCRVFALAWERSAIHRRVEARVAEMFSQGLVEEVRSLLEQYRELGRTAMQAVGYKEPLAHLRGELSLEETIQLVIFHTRQFVRRQEMWFRSLPEIRPIPMDTDSSWNHIADRIWSTAV